MQPTITFYGTDCTNPSTGEGSAYDVVEEAPLWLALDVHDAETYYFTIEPQDSQQTLSDFKLSELRAGESALQRDDMIRAIERFLIKF